MITVQDFTEAVDFQITGGSEYCWDCFGPDARYLDAEIPQKSQSSIIFGGPERTVFICELFDFVNKRAYRWINPDYKKPHADEAERREVKLNQAWDEADFTELEVAEDILSKIKEVIKGNFNYDTRVSIPLEFTDEELLTYMKLAHDLDITFNQLVERAIKEAMEKYGVKND